MSTRIYFPSSGAAPVTPADWEFAEQINPLTFEGKLFPSGSAMTSKTEATGIVSPIFRAVLRYVIGPLKAVTMNGTVRGQIGGSENNAGANGSPAIAIKFIQPDGTDRGVLLAATASDAASATHEFATSLTNSKFENAAEVTSIPLTQQAAQAGDYLVIEIGFRAATTTTRNITLRYGDAAASDLPEDTSGTTDLNPWVEFSSNFELQTSLNATDVLITGGSVCSGGEHRIVQTNFGDYSISTSDLVDVTPDTQEKRRYNALVNLRNYYFEHLAKGMTPAQAQLAIIGRRFWL